MQTNFISLVHCTFLKFYFTSLDATDEKTNGLCLGRLVNHGKKDERNAVVKCLTLSDGSPTLALISTRDLHPGEEILYDYGLPEAKLPWNKKVSTKAS